MLKISLSHAFDAKYRMAIPMPLTAAPEIIFTKNKEFFFLLSILKVFSLVKLSLDSKRMDELNEKIDEKIDKVENYSF